MTALTRTDLVNLALREIGTTRIEDYTEATPEAEVASDLWEQAVRMTLSRHEWGFAMRGARLARQSTAPATRYDYTYTLPGDYVRLGSLSEYATMNPPLDDYRVRGSVVDTNAESVYAEYVYDAPPEGEWSPWFVQVFSADLASLMASPLKSTTERERLEQLALARLREGRAIDSQHGPVLTYQQGSWVAAARGRRVR